jgi:hypothetical protein
MKRSSGDLGSTPAGAGPTVVAAPSGEGTALIEHNFWFWGSLKQVTFVDVSQRAGESRGADRVVSSSMG